LWLKGIVAFAVIGMALVVGFAGLALPWILSHPEKVQSFLSERLKRPVRFARLTGQWYATGPVFTLSEVEVGASDAAAEPLRIEQAELAINFYAWLRSGVSFSEFRVVGIDIEAERAVDGAWHLARLGSGGQSAGDGAALFDLGSVNLKQAKLRVVDHVRDTRMEFARIDLRLVNELGTHRFGGTLWADEDSPPVRFACSGARSGRGSCYVEAREVEPAKWLTQMPVAGIAPASGRASAQIWAEFDQGLSALRVEAETQDLVLRGITPVVFSDADEVEPRALLPSWRVAARWQRQAQGWHADLLDWADPLVPEPSAHWRVRADAASDGEVAAESNAAASPALEILADRIDLARYASVLALGDFLPAGARRLLYESAPRGTLRDFQARGVWPALAGQTQAEGLSLIPGTKLPGVSPIGGELLFDRDALVFLPKPESAFTVDYPFVFRAPISAVLHQGTIGVLATPEGVRLEGVDLDFDGEGFGMLARLSVLFDGEGKRPTLDGSMLIKHADVQQAKLFWPLNIMPRRTQLWLDEALLGGRIVGGEAVVRGDLDDWPFKKAQGRFEARAHLRAVDLAFHPRWPQARLDDAEAVFIGLGMTVDIARAQTGGIAVTGAHAYVEDLSEAALVMQANAAAPAAKLLDYLRNTTLQDTLGDYLSGLSLDGQAEGELTLNLPIKYGEQPTRLNGHVALLDADIADPRWGIALDQSTGTLAFDESGFAIDDMVVHLRGDPARLGMASGNFLEDRNNFFEAKLSGDLPAASVLANFAAAAPLVERMPGRAPWEVNLAVTRSDAQTPAHQRLSGRSSLKGIALNFPAPLRKDADSVLPLRFELALPVAGSELSLSLGELMQLSARMPAVDQPAAAYIGFGVAEAQAPPERGFVIRGDVPALDMDGWLDLAGVSTGVESDMELHAGELRVFSRRFDDVRFATRVDAAHTQLSIDGAQALGTLDIPRADPTRGITAEFERLHLPEPSADAPAPAVDPAALPALHIWAKDLRFGQAQLGEVRIETFPTAQGMQIDSVVASSPNIEVRASGDWRVIEGVERSQFDITFTAQSLGKMLDALGFAGMVEGGQTIARIQGSWPGTPGQFSLANIDGALEASVGQGRIPEVSPGAGRMFGLISIHALPRRLSLDFSDFFASGLAFDTITGKFALRDGNAYTDNLTIKGPSADIVMRGRTGIRARDYDQEMEVTPRVGGVLPVVALAAGPAGAAAGLVVQNILPIDKAARARYKVVGSWDKPEITLIAREKPASSRSGEQPPAKQPPVL
jgi:uncharacterized protein (TIGR02099 family)